MASAPEQWEALKESIVPGLRLDWRRNSYAGRVSGHYHCAWKGADPFISMAVGRAAKSGVVRRVLIHECAHHLAESNIDGRPSHREAFYRVLLPLYDEQYPDDQEYAEALGGEFYYKKTALRTYSKLVAEGLIRPTSSAAAS